MISAWVTEELARARSVVANDPLGVTGSLVAELMPRVAQVRDKLGELGAIKARVEAALRDAGALESRIKEARTKASALSVSVPQEIVGFVVPPGANAEEVLGLGPWREKLADTARAGRWHAADVGLVRWFEVARELLGSDHAVCTVLGEALERRAELVGRLSARRAQAMALVSRGAPGAGNLSGLADTAARALEHRPTDLDGAARAVDAYEAELKRLTSAGRP